MLSSSSFCELAVVISDKGNATNISVNKIAIVFFFFNLPPFLFFFY